MNRPKVALTDYWALTQNYTVGDIVSPINPRNGGVEDFTGVVTAVLPGIGFVDVEYPWGNERVSPEYIYRRNKDYTPSYPPVIDTSYSGWDVAQSRREQGVPEGYTYANPKQAMVRALAASHDDRHQILAACAHQCLHHGLGEVDAYEAISRTLYGGYGDSEIRQAVASTYSKQGLYWTAPGRQYRMTEGEIEDGLPNCPKCKTNLQKTNYKKHTKLFVCPICLFCIKPSDIEGLPGVIEEDGFGTEEGAPYTGFEVEASRPDTLPVKSPRPVDIRQLYGSPALLQRIHSVVASGASAATVASQFEKDFASYGLGDAMFLLGSATADGLFNRHAYNRLVRILDQIRQDLRVASLVPEGA